MLHKYSNLVVAATAVLTFYLLSLGSSLSYYCISLQYSIRSLLCHCSKRDGEVH